MKQDYLQMRVLELAPQVYASAQLFEHDLTAGGQTGCSQHHEQPV